MRLAKHLAPVLGGARDLRHAAFTDGDGAVALVLQSGQTRRRLDLLIAPSGVTISAIWIDEHKLLKRLDLAVHDTERILELARWLIRAASVRST